MKQVYIVTTRHKDFPKFSLQEIWGVFESGPKACDWIAKFPIEEQQQYYVQTWQVK